MVRQKGYRHLLTNSINLLLKSKIHTSKIELTSYFINFIERKKLPQNKLLVTMDVTSLCTNTPQEQGMQIVCAAYDKF